VKRVFIDDSFQDLMPRWLKFVKGVVDSDDLPLNVSREILQKSKVLSIINKRLVRKSLDMIRDISEDDSDEGANYIVSHHVQYRHLIPRSVLIGRFI